MAKQQIPTLQAQGRTKLGTHESARLRKAGPLPVVIYGHKKDPVHATCDYKQLYDLVSQHAKVIEVQHDGAKEPCLIKEVQWDHLGSQLVHLDLTRVDLNERVKVDVQVTFTGEAIGLKEAGAFIEHPVTSIEVECLVTEIPESLTADVSKLGVGDTLTVKDVVLPPGVVAVTEADMVLASVSMAAAEEEVVAAVPGEEGAAEPEVIGRKVAEGEEGAAEEGESAPKAKAPAEKPEKKQKEDKK
jgi:large subunit ribosomal protein L25